MKLKGQRSKLKGSAKAQAAGQRRVFLPEICSLDLPLTFDLWPLNSPPA
jgi:hypothetical protein